MHQAAGRRAAWDRKAGALAPNRQQDQIGPQDCVRDDHSCQEAVHAHTVLEKGVLRGRLRVLGPGPPSPSSVTRATFLAPFKVSTWHSTHFVALRWLKEAAGGRQVCKGLAQCQVRSECTGSSDH